MTRLTHPDRPTRQATRLADFDYSRAGSYFITTCTQNRVCLLSTIVDGGVCLTPSGEMVLHWWVELNRKFAPRISTDACVIMPNHIHGVVVISDLDLQGQFISDEVPTRALPEVMEWFKTMSTNGYFRGVKGQGWPPVDKRLWQRGYHDRIIRSARELNRYRQYIERNPARWEFDKNHPNMATM
jgi:putative transposase